MRFIPTVQKATPLHLKQVLQKKSLLKRLLQKQLIEIIFIHGSLAKDQLKPLSDVDVAILFKENASSYENLHQAYDTLCKFFKREDIDIGVLNHASPLFAMQVLKNGIPLYCRKETYLKRFRLQAIQRYLATKHLRRMFNDYVEQSVLRRT
ncbi:MAG: nucleotidyltransferase domain-containing protein [Deltaproteobacteria bacterium]|nr:nucleotidyltransferase domain-containing protein [Deltaproteobacteria bacterium]